MHITPLYLLIASGRINTHTPDKSISRNQAPPDLKLFYGWQWLFVMYATNQGIIIAIRQMAAKTHAANIHILSPRQYALIEQSV